MERERERERESECARGEKSFAEKWGISGKTRIFGKKLFRLWRK
jgi:hypothetical protein